MGIHESPWFVSSVELSPFPIPIISLPFLIPSVYVCVTNRGAASLWLFVDFTEIIRYIFSCRFLHSTPGCALHVCRLGNGRPGSGFNSFPVRLSRIDACFGQRPSASSPSQSSPPSPLSARDRKFGHIAGRGRWDCPAPLSLPL